MSESKLIVSGKSLIQDQVLNSLSENLNTSFEAKSPTLFASVKSMAGAKGEHITSTAALGIDLLLSRSNPEMKFTGVIQVDSKISERMIYEEAWHINKSAKFSVIMEFKLSEDSQILFLQLSNLNFENTITKKSEDLGAKIGSEIVSSTQLNHIGDKVIKKAKRSIVSAFDILKNTSLKTGLKLNKKQLLQPISFDENGDLLIISRSI